ncbi:hypothetical protein SLS55_005952 [Diplodia seriata]|uniref:FAD-binding domain-containing protein n=1 Tax=Diplodia seriata TaxID=420778 RepID=A0ABR3CG80_9PEZI
MGIYPETFGATVNESITFRDKNAVALFSKHYAEERKHWQASANKGKLIEHFAGFSAPVMRMLDKAPADDVMLWDLLDMEVLPTFVKDRAVLIGDAAHPFLPYMGQGAAQAVEDAAALGACLPAGTPAAEVPQRLRVWEQCRKERADWVQEVTRVRGRDPNGKQGPPQTPEAFAEALERCVSHNAWDHAVNVMNSLKEGSNDQKIAASL